ncbi:hypothetical protein MMU07_14320 [Aquiflexum sp. LQ15W]|uniref:hypothetical protein n=1 Tax=Cognataquiflexum nitidum TaxID=2922272 RepID=UPI001F145C90|nr:hypothetical protein [Cognataquiflexum nitidum]MCH6200757.1 hypothetical protein [Cognataquiflexum nitidum]
MKKQHNQNKIYSLVFSMMLVLTLALSGCGDEVETPQPSAQDIAREKLTSATWKLTKVTVDGVDQTNVYKDLTLTFSNTAYSSTNGKVIWPSSGSWTFDNDQATAIKRNDGLEISIQNLTNSSLRMGLDWESTSIGTGRVLAVGGKHVFEFGK